MTIYSLYIYDRYGFVQQTDAGLLLTDVRRHCNCVYYHDWHRTRRPKAAVPGGLLPGVSRAVSPLPPSSEIDSNNTTPFTSPRNTLASNSGIVVAFNDIPPSPSPLSQAHQAPQAGGPQPTSTGLPFDEEAKLVYGVILSLRNMVKRLSGRYVLLHLRANSKPRPHRLLETSSLSTIAHQHIKCICTKRSRDISLSCSAIPMPSPSVTCYNPSIQDPFWSTSFEIRSSNWIPEIEVSTTSTFELA